MKTAIHISHEAARKIGGIGAVLSGLCNSKSYQQSYHRTIFYGPLFSNFTVNSNQEEEFRVRYSSLTDVETSYKSLQAIARNYNIDLIYGTKKVYDEIHPEQSAEVEVILTGIGSISKEAVDRFKYVVWERFGLNSEPYHDWDYEQYMRIAVPFNEIIASLCAEENELSLFAHEYMGVPCCLRMLAPDKAVESGMNLGKQFKTCFYAHEVSTARSIVEKIPGHDYSFYNLMERDLAAGKSLEERFGSQKHNYRNELVKLAVHFDTIIAVGDLVKKEYLYLTASDKAVKELSTKIKIEYNRIPVYDVDFERKTASRKLLQEYCESLFNYLPDVIFTHVTRLVISKGLWRDIRFLEEMDDLFGKHKLKGFFILLSSLVATGRTPAEIEQMEQEYGWPLLHKEGYPDLLGYEKDVYASVALFNAKSRAIKGVFINQYGFSRATTGKRIPQDTSFTDIRCGSDVELGFSVYEPFGIAQIENIPYGGLAYLSRQCGSSYLLEECFKDSGSKPFHIIDFAESGEGAEMTLADDKLVSLSAQERSEFETKLFRKDASAMFEKIPKNDEERERYFKQAKANAVNLSWDNWQDI